MAAANRAFHEQKSASRSEFLTKGIKCVFISHQKRDKEEAKKIADYLIGAGIDVYFDEYDNDLKFQYQNINPKRVTDAIRKGINNSSHMLVLVSPNTIRSQWVPWEVGYGYDKTDLAALTLKGISDEDLPDYLKTVVIIRGTESLNKYLAQIVGNSYTSSQAISLMQANLQNHPLDNYLDWRL